MIRGRWMSIFAILFTLLASIIVYFGSLSGGAGFNRTSASLLNMTLFLIPLIALLAGSTSVAGEKEDGGLSLVMTYPIYIHQLLLGKFFGLLLSLFAVMAIGYGVAGTVMYWAVGGLNLNHFVLFFGFSLLLSAVFIALAIFVGMLANNRFQALGYSIFLWAFFVLLYEFVVMGISGMLPPSAVIPVFSASILLNPVELVRVWTIIILKSGSIFGPTLYDLTIWSESLIGQLTFTAAAIGWIALPLLGAYWLMGRGGTHD